MQERLTAMMTMQAMETMLAMVVNKLAMVEALVDKLVAVEALVDKLVAVEAPVAALVAVAAVAHAAHVTVEQLVQLVPMERQGEMVLTETMDMLVPTADLEKALSKNTQDQQNVDVKLALKVMLDLPDNEEQPVNVVLMEKMELMDRTPKVQEMASLERPVPMANLVQGVHLVMTVPFRQRHCQLALQVQPDTMDQQAHRVALDQRANKVQMDMLEKLDLLVELVALERMATMAAQAQQAPAVDKEIADIVPQQDWHLGIKNISEFDKEHQPTMETILANDNYRLICLTILLMFFTLF